MNIEIYADGSDFYEMCDALDTVDGFTTNPTLMKAAGVENYEDFARAVLNRITTHPVSFEVFADDEPEMERQARKLAALGENVFVKIPIMNTKGFDMYKLINRLLRDGIKINVTAVFSYEQIIEVTSFMRCDTDAILSVFVGRIADTGRDPKPFIVHALNLAPPNVKVLWASCRETYNIYEAENIGCHIITVPPNLLKKLSLRNKDLEEYSRETVQMFYNDAKASNYTL